MATESDTVIMASLVTDLEKLFALFALNLLASIIYHCMNLHLKYKSLLFIYSILVVQISCAGTIGKQPVNDLGKPIVQSLDKAKEYRGIIVGAQRTAAYFSLLDSQRIAIVANKTSRIGKTHLVDSLLGAGMDIKKIFALEHGFRGDAANGEHIVDGKDPKTGLPIVSLYGSNKKPTAAQLADVDIVVFDLQDVGVRFYTYLSSMHYIMQACAENKKTLIVLDRPNPNGHYTDGPILDLNYKSMVGMHPIPLVHGMTLGELAFMINGEGWLKTQDSCPLVVVKCTNYVKSASFGLPVAPSPNLPSFESIILYPSLGLFEGTEMSMGRGTEKPFECFGAPWLKMGTYYFTPQDIPGKAVNPPYEGIKCRGYLLHDFARFYMVMHKKVYLEWLIMLYKDCPDKSKFFKANFFDKLAGGSQLRLDITAGLSSADIRAKWDKGLTKFKKDREPYMIYSL